MGIIIKQSIRGSIWSYLGVAIGFVTTAYLYPNYLTTDTVGLFGLLLSYAALLAQFSSLGINGVTARLFPYFRNKKNGHNGYLVIAFLFGLAGFSLFLVTYYLVSPWLIESNIEKSKLFADFSYLLIPLTFFTLFFTILDVYNKLLYNAVLGTLLQEFVQRLFIFIVVALFAFGFINDKQLIYWFTIVVCLKGLILFIYLVNKSEISFTPQFSFLNKKLIKEIGNVALFNILAGVGGSIVFNIDKIIVNQMIGLSATGVYTIAFFFGTLVMIPSRPLLRISGTLIADAWSQNNIKYITDIYRRSCINQFIIAAFLFGGIWINIDNIMIILGPEYADAKWIIFFIGLANLIDMLTGANGQIIGYSKYYRVALYFLIVLIFLVFITMIIFIPISGIVGASIAIAVSMFAYNVMRYLFILYKYKMQPFTIKFVFVPVSFGIAFFFCHLLFKLPLISDILVRSIIFALIYGGLILLLRISEDVNNQMNKLLFKIGIKK